MIKLYVKLPQVGYILSWDPGVMRVKLGLFSHGIPRCTEGKVGFVLSWEPSLGG